MNLDRTVNLARTAALLAEYVAVKEQPALNLTFQDAGGQTHVEPLSRYDGQPYRVMALLGAGITQRALIRLTDGRTATMPALAL